jgi:hypothetical protein
MTLPMWQLYQFPLCPFSRKVRLALTEKAIPHALVRVSPWLQEDEFMDLNPAGQTPVLVESDKSPAPRSTAPRSAASSPGSTRSSIATRSAR